jgi:hypothetical protein
MGPGLSKAKPGTVSLCSIRATVFLGNKRTLSLDSSTQLSGILPTWSLNA